MEFIIKNEYNNGDQDILEIYHPTNKIKEVWNFTYTEQNIKVNEETGKEYIEEETKAGQEIMLWSPTEEDPLPIAKTRLDDYSVSDELLESETNLEDIM